MQKEREIIGILQTSVICLEDNFDELEHIISELFKIYFEKV